MLYTAPTGSKRDSGPDKAARAMKEMVVNVTRNGAGPLTGSVVYAEDRLSRYEDPERAIQRIVNESAAAAGTAGFVTGVGGFAAMPVTLPANIAGNLVINARMVGAIAHLRGYDLEDPHTQAVLMLVVAGTSAQNAAAMLGAKLGAEWTKQAIKKIPIAVIREINKRAGFYLVAKYGTKRAALTLTKAVPVVGGVVGGGIDAGLTKFIGHQAVKVFPAV